MTVVSWRIVALRRQKAAFSGEGAGRHPGRWNLQGVPMVYTASSLALAAIEILANTPYKYLASQSYVAVAAAFDEALVRRIDLALLPENWAQHPPGPDTRVLGSLWAKEGGSAVLAVPSSVIPTEMNFLINPRHPDFRTISIGKPEAFAFDKRLLR